MKTPGEALLNGRLRKTITRVIGKPGSLRFRLAWDTVGVMVKKGDVSLFLVLRENPMSRGKKSYRDDIIDSFLGMLLPLRKDIKAVYLLSSTCREDFRPDSDYDILIVLENKDRVIIDSPHDAAMEILLATGKLISLKIFIVLEFNRLKSIPTPFMHNVTTEGIRLGRYD